KFTKKLNMTLSIQDSCYAKMFGDNYVDIPRKILNLAGAKVVETDSSRENMRCCGIGAGFSVDSAYHSFKIRSSTIRNFRAFKKTKADAVCVYCAGCLATFGGNKKLYFKKLKVFHIIELIQMAMGEKPSLTEKSKKERGKHFFWGAIKHQLPKLYSQKTFLLKKISENPPDYKRAW
ncbi:MAG: heterodisulfide reductase-related iron-sulfur binding cluster, partial [Candidatus Thorarchaeota archaeon]